MGRLIDADALLQEIEESANAVEIQIHLGKCNKDVAKGMLSGLALVRENILRKPTAYNVEKVLEQLEEAKSIISIVDFESLKPIGLISLDNAIDLVRKGGVE